MLDAAEIADACLYDDRSKLWDLLKRGVNPSLGLVFAVQSENPELLQVLLDADADPDFELFFSPELNMSLRALGVAAQTGQLRCVRLLCESGANPWLEDRGQRPSQWAREEGLHEIREYLEMAERAWVLVKYRDLLPDVATAGWAEMVCASSG